MVNPFLTKLMVDARIAELRAGATPFPAGIFDESAPAAHRIRHEGDAITLRFAGAADDTMLARLADLDSAVVPAPPVLLAEVGGELRAALSLHDASLIADSFRHTAAAQQLLLARAAQLRGERRVSWWRRALGHAKTQLQTARPGAARAVPLPNPIHRRTR